MARRFRGESVHKVDSKGRVSIPAPFRRVLEEGDPDWKPGENANLVIVYGRRGRNCLEGYSMNSMSEVDDMVSDLPRYSREREILERMLNTQSVYAQVDENGRIVLPAKLRERIGVSKEATFAGMGDKFQIWEPEAYAEDMNRIDDWLSDQGEEDDPFALLDRRRAEG
ncbi:division/cell wall cluster transcriptional repressor MraZ [Oceanomicrobium pacificus]|uniref:Transcriptional regulator MraZ n=1 Tax=Oceanomicrobium pacificus TaxID=2692916 RepID=A0A6B0TNH4_9RHOB|nr:division/cell wall cluster transcriptional repressor MraZ [Oceanomicrobium pacificus]MXU65416.1 division/cell wall cluster transcriptional repressor MraZ [Oceanomicrobium pacificus]